MATVQRDLAEMTTVLSAWLAKQAGVDATITNVVAPASGMSSETYLLDVDVEDASGPRHVRWALRIQASKYQVYDDPSVEKQFRVLDVLGRTTDLPVPATHWYESDASVLGSPFFLMDCIEGEAPPDNHHLSGILVESTPSERERMWRQGVTMLAQIHRQDSARFAFLDRPDLGGNGLEQEIERWDRYRHWTGLPEVPVLEKARRWLADNQPPPPPTGLAWGDARLGNFLFRDAECVAILDWETTSLSCGETDLGWWLYYDASCVADAPGGWLEGIGNRAQTIALWEQEVGRKAQAIDWHEIHATWRFAWISKYAIHLMVAAGVQLPAELITSNPAVRRMEQVMSQGV